MISYQHGYINNNRVKTVDVGVAASFCISFDTRGLKSFSYSVGASETTIGTKRFDRKGEIKKKKNMINNFKLKLKVIFKTCVM